MPYATPQYWQPNAISQPPVGYPTPVGASAAPPQPSGVGQVRFGGRDVAVYGRNMDPTGAQGMRAQMDQMMAQRNASVAAQNQAHAASVGNSIGWGGKGVPVGGSSWRNLGAAPGMGMMGNAAMGRGGYAPPGTGAGGGSIGGGGGAPGAGGGATGPLGASYQQAMNNANQANEARYQDILRGYQERYARNMDMLAGRGAQEGQDISDRYRSQEAQRRQQLIGRGLGNSTVVNTMQMGNERERANDLGRLNERIRQQTLAADAGLTGDTLQFMERRTDAQPDVRLLAQLAQGMGSAGYGMPAGVGGGGYGAPSMDVWTTGGFGMGMPNPYAFVQQRFPDPPRGPAAFRGNVAGYQQARDSYNQMINDPEYMAWAGR